MLLTTSTMLSSAYSQHGSILHSLLPSLDRTKYKADLPVDEAYVASAPDHCISARRCAIPLIIVHVISYRESTLECSRQQHKISTQSRHDHWISACYTSGRQPLAQAELHISY